MDTAFLQVHIFLTEIVALQHDIVASNTFKNEKYNQVLPDIGFSEATTSSWLSTEGRMAISIWNAVKNSVIGSKFLGYESDASNLSETLYIFFWVWLYYIIRLIKKFVPNPNKSNTRENLEDKTGNYIYTLYVLCKRKPLITLLRSKRLRLQCIRFVMLLVKYHCISRMNVWRANIVH